MAQVPGTDQDGTFSSMMLSSQVKMMSSAVKGWPSDHFAPLMRFMVRVRPSEDQVQSVPTLGKGSFLSFRRYAGPEESRVVT